jgi:DNA-binding NarL/FixJ family response regulator
MAIPSPIRVLLVDDQAPFRAAARAVLSRATDFSLVAEVETGEQAVAAATSGDVQLVLMDIHLPGISGIEATRRITAARRDVVVILLSTYQLGDLPADAQTSGAAAYVHKEEFGASVLRKVWAERDSVSPSG